MRKAIFIIALLVFSLSGCSDDDGIKRGSSHATMKIDGVPYEFTNFHTGYVAIEDGNGDPALSLYTRGEWVGNTPEHEEHLVMRFYNGGALHNKLWVAALVIDDEQHQDDWSMQNDAPWDITFTQNNDEGVHATFGGPIRTSSGIERIVTEGVLDITYGDDNYGEGNTDFP